MKDIKLDEDEGIIKQTNNVERYQVNDKYTEIYEMYLTNKNLIFVYEKSIRLLKTKDVVEKVPLTDIKIVNNKIQVSKVDDNDYGLGMKIIFKNGSSDHFVFEKDKEISPWINSITEALMENKDNIKNNLEEKSNDNDKVKEQAKETKGSNKNYMYCSNCGAMIDINSKFCNSCGTKVNLQTSAEENAKEEKEETTERKVIYEGKIHKCPNCGEPIKAFEIKCSACGYELREVKVNNAVKELAQKLEKAKTIEEKEDLISNFYIPNTKEEIYDFFILASSNIQYNEYGINAWFSKLEQAYHKAKMTSSASQEFQYIEKLYQTIKRKRLIYSAINNIKNSKVLQGLLIGIPGAILTILGQFKGEASGNPDSSYYFLSTLGMIIIMCAMGLVVIGITDNKNNNDDDD